ncbi:hypothetical protein PanWU01x14_332870, partial [Parasponia andersonii]
MSKQPHYLRMYFFAIRMRWIISKNVMNDPPSEPNETQGSLQIIQSEYHVGNIPIVIVFQEARLQADV